MGKLSTWTVLALAAAVGFTWLPQGNPQSKQNPKRGQQQGARSAYPLPESRWKEGTVLLGNPTDTSLDIVFHSANQARVRVQYRLQGGASWTAGRESDATVGTPVSTRLNALRPNSAYAYRVEVKRSGQGDWISSPEYRFQTQRKPGNAFTFFVQGDSHPERVPKMHIPDLYERTLLTAASQKPDFFICLGDDFSIDTLKDLNAKTIEGAYLKQVPYLGLVGNSAPIYLVNGNHEQAARVNLDGTPNSIGALAQNARNRNFPQPAPDGFYSGNTENVPHIGLLRNYFAWTWGDALFVVIDPYWHSTSAVDNELQKGPKTEGGGKRNRNLWDITLGDDQYKWLSKTLTESNAKFKFVFAHHVHGTGRGGVEQAPYYEWGGKDRNGVDVFKSKRPGWPLPIHQLMVKTGVSIFFQGHDHIFCKQVLDGVIYQTCPCPADPTNSLINGDAYRTGDKVPGSGLVRVSVEPGQAKVDYLRTYEPSAETDGRKHGETAFSYVVKPIERGSKS